MNCNLSYWPTPVLMPVKGEFVGCCLLLGAVLDAFTLLGYGELFEAGVGLY